MENTGTVCTHVADPSPRLPPPDSLPQEQWPWSRSTSRDRSPREKMGEETSIKDNVIIVGKVAIWPMRAILNIKLQQKRTKRKRETL